MGDKGVHFVSYYMNSLRGIDTLKMDNCKMTDLGIGLLTNSLKKFKIDKLFLNGNLITMRGVQMLYDYVVLKPGIRLISLKRNNLDRSKFTKIIKDFGAKNVTLFL